MAKMNRTKPLNHHIIYNEHDKQEVVVSIYPIEHYICTLLQRRGSLISKGFIKHLKFFVWKYEDGAQDLSASSAYTISESKSEKRRKDVQNADDSM